VDSQRKYCNFARSLWFFIGFYQRVFNFTLFLMSITPNKYITVAYELFTENNGERQMVEKATEQQPFQFISGLGTTLDAFENQVKDLAKDAAFDFTLSVEDAYGEYEQSRVIELDKKVFEVDGHFDKSNIFAGNIVPLVNADGIRFNGLVSEVKDTTVVMDLNHPLAGKELNFVGRVIETRDATKDEIQGMLNMLSGEGCGCGCDDCKGDCDCDDDECCGHHHDGCKH
jgi:FKBP-type peptidyl-prolyl cis-trans isomerase SlyD